MLRISKARSPQQLVTYHQREFTAVHESYHSEGNRVVGVWHGQLREVFGLPEAIDLEAFSRLTRAHHPTTDETLIRGVTRGGWDSTFSAPKGVSLAGIVGDDERVRVAHRESVAAALRLIEPYTQARGVRIALEEGRPVRRDVTTRRALWATYAHYLARPVDGVEQPQLHTHVIGFNVTQTDDGRWHSVQPREWFRTQQLGTMAYYAELAVRLQALGYTIERGPYDEPRVVGFTEAYLEASSPRRQQIEEALAAQGRSGPAAAEEAALRTRARKVHRPPEQVRADHLALAREHGNQPQRVVAQALARGFVKQSGQFDELINTSTREAVQRAKDRGMERSAVIEDRTLLADALRIGLGHVTVASVAAEFERRLGVGEFVPRTSHSAARAFTTPEMLALERTNIELMRAGQSTCPAIADIDVAATYPHLNPDQQVAVQTILGSRDQIQALEGIAGSGKSTALAVLHQAAAAAGWRVEGLAPSTPAASNLERAGIKSQTLQRHLATPLVPRDHLSFADRVRRGIDPDHAERLLILDEASLASSVQVHQLLTTLGPRDRVLLVGDIGQHQSVDAGKAHEQLQDHGIGAARLSKIVRQRGPGYRQIVSRLAARQTVPAIAALQRRGRVHVVPDRHARLTALAADYVASPEGTLIIAPDNQTRRDINAVVHQALQAKGGVGRDGRLTPVLLPRTDLTTSDSGVRRQLHRRRRPALQQRQCRPWRRGGHVCDRGRPRARDEPRDRRARDRRGADVRCACRAAQRLPSCRAIVCAGRSRTVHRALARAARGES